MMKKEYAHLAASAAEPGEAIERIKEIISILRRECPWDKKQTHETLRGCMIEEAYEVVEAIDKKDRDNLREELGDVLLQVVFHSNLSEENGNFDLTDVINDECEKMIRRHPHVFLQEKKNTTKTQDLKGVPNALPALIRAAKVQKKAAEVGFDWNDAQGALDKIREETDELTEAGNRAEVTEELGDLLFSVVNAARFLKVDPEDALNMATKKFIRRFAYIEDRSLSCGKLLKDMSLEEMDELWNEAKKSENGI